MLPVVPVLLVLPVMGPARAELLEIKVHFLTFPANFTSPKWRGEQLLGVFSCNSLDSLTPSPYSVHRAFPFLLVGSAVAGKVQGVGRIRRGGSSLLRILVCFLVVLLAFKPTVGGPPGERWAKTCTISGEGQ